MVPRCRRERGVHQRVPRRVGFMGAQSVPRDYSPHTTVFTVENMKKSNGGGCMQMRSAPPTGAAACPSMVPNPDVEGRSVLASTFLPPRSTPCRIILGSLPLSASAPLEWLSDRAGGSDSRAWRSCWKRRHRRTTWGRTAQWDRGYQYSYVLPIPATCPWTTRRHS